MRKRFVARARASFSFCALLTISCASMIVAPSLAQVPSQAANDASGPYNVTILQGGEGLARKLVPGTASLEAGGSWSMTGWVKPARNPEKAVVLFGVGSSPEAARALLIAGGRFMLFADGRTVESGAEVPAGKWTALAATFDGKRARLYVNGSEVGGDELTVGAATGDLSVAPVVERPDVEHFGGQLAGLKLHSRALDPKQVQALFAAKPDFDTVVFHE